MLRILIILTLTQALYAGETASKLYGSWKSSHKLTKAYLMKFAKLDAYQKNTLPNFFGNSVITFNRDGTGNIDIKAMSFPKKDGDGEFKLPATKTAFIYKILGESKSQLVIKTETDMELFADFPFAILRFEDPNTYSVSLSDSISDINGREFFTRIKPTKKANKAQ
jgi:hypothetical protein